jgi:hypothetical protein
MPIKGRYRKKTFRIKGGKPNIRQRSIKNKIGGGEWTEAQYRKFYEQLNELPKNVNIPPTVQKFIDNVERGKNQKEIFKKYSKNMPNFNQTILSIRKGGPKEIQKIINEVFVKKKPPEQSNLSRSASISTIDSDDLPSSDGINRFEPQDVPTGEDPLTIMNEEEKKNTKKKRRGCQKNSKSTKK